VAEHKVTCINKPYPLSPHEHITHIGGYGWRITREEAIRRIDAGTDRYYVQDPVSGRVAYVGVVREYGRVAYLRTHADGDWNNNLLSLGQCSIS
jgi:Protein of unknown function (DUF3892)